MTYFEVNFKPGYKEFPIGEEKPIWVQPDFILIGKTIEEIDETLWHYQFELSKEIKERTKGGILEERFFRIPFDLKRRELAIEEIAEVCIPNEGLMVGDNQYIDVEVLPGVIFSVDASAYRDVREKATNFDSLYRGTKKAGLYKWDGLGRRSWGPPLWYLPRDIMEALQKYDWTPHRKQMHQWLEERTQSRIEAIKQGRLAGVELEIDRKKN